ncbi:MAG: glycosyltransferase family 39 protein [Candidatus Binataceae bacterium]
MREGTDKTVSDTVGARDGSPASAAVVRRVAVGLIVASLLVGAFLRFVRLGRVPPGWHPDELSNLYDAYAILTTGRDQYGHLLPLAFKAFGDYRMPLFIYSLVPLTAVFGMKPVLVRIGAAMWGMIDIGAITALAGVTLGLPAAAAAAILGALSPWHVPFSRYGIEATLADASVSLAILCFFLWVARPRSRWLVLSAILLGLSLYTYAVTKPIVPLMVALLGLTYRRELGRQRRMALIALGIIAVLAAPQAALLWLHPEMMARFRLLSIFSRGDPLLANLGAGWLSYFTPSFLFLTGDRGDHWTLIHPQGFGQLLPEQIPLILLALLALFDARRRKFAIVAFGWVMLAAVPAALTMPLAGCGKSLLRPFPA